MPNDELLLAELTAVRFKYSSAGKQQIESKEEIKKRNIFLIQTSARVPCVGLDNGFSSFECHQDPVQEPRQ